MQCYIYLYTIVYCIIFIIIIPWFKRAVLIVQDHSGSNVIRRVTSRVVEELVGVKTIVENGIQMYVWVCVCTVREDTG
jgi:hypothetical protein